MTFNTDPIGSKFRAKLPSLISNPTSKKALHEEAFDQASTKAPKPLHIQITFTPQEVETMLKRWSESLYATGYEMRWKGDKNTEELGKRTAEGVKQLLMHDNDTRLVVNLFEMGAFKGLLLHKPGNQP